MTLQQSFILLTKQFLVLQSVNRVSAFRSRITHVNACSDIMPADGPHCLPTLSYLDSQVACHHAVMLHLANPRARLHQINKDYVAEETGLIVPYQYDCTPWEAEHKYHNSVPNRNLRCEMQKAMTTKGLSQAIIELPVVDEEYLELVAVYQAALRAKDKFVMVELGARWGTWGSRAVSYLRRFNHNVHSYDLLYVEPDPVAADGLQTVQSLNNILNYTLVQSLANASIVMDWASKHAKIDVFDVDIQGAEMTLLPDLESLLTSKVSRLILGTHSSSIHSNMREFVVHKLGWTILHELPFSKNTTCVNENLRSQIDLNAIKQQGCYARTPFGNVAQWDGEIIADNPNFVERNQETHACMVRTFGA